MKTALKYHLKSKKKANYDRKTTKLRTNFLKKLCKPTFWSYFDFEQWVVQPKFSQLQVPTGQNFSLFVHTCSTFFYFFSARTAHWIKKPSLGFETLKKSSVFFFEWLNCLQSCSFCKDFGILDYIAHLLVFQLICLNYFSRWLVDNPLNVWWPCQQVEFCHSSELTCIFVRAQQIIKMKRLVVRPS